MVWKASRNIRSLLAPLLTPYNFLYTKPMTKNPFYNALFAIAYIVILITVAFSTSSIFAGKEDTIFIPMGMLSLLVFSVALMAYLFFYQPVLMLIEGKREQAVKLFLHTIGIFAIGTALLLLVSLLLSL